MKKILLGIALLLGIAAGVQAEPIIVDGDTLHAYASVREEAQRVVYTAQLFEQRIYQWDGDEVPAIGSQDDAAVSAAKGQSVGYIIEIQEYAASQDTVDMGDYLKVTASRDSLESLTYTFQRNRDGQLLYTISAEAAEAGVTPDTSQAGLMTRFVRAKTHLDSAHAARGKPVVVE